MYAHHPASDLKIPHHDAGKRRVMKMGEIAVQETKDMFAVCILAYTRWILD